MVSLAGPSFAIRLSLGIEQFDDAICRLRCAPPHVERLKNGLDIVWGMRVRVFGHNVTVRTHRVMRSISI